MPTTTIIKQAQSIPRHVWLSLQPITRLRLLLNKDVEMDDDGLPVVRGEMLARTLLDVEIALGLRAAAPAMAGGAS